METETNEHVLYDQTILYAFLILFIAFLAYKFPDIRRNYQNFLNEQCNQEETADEFPKFTACKSPDCVRCRKYQDIRKQAKGRLQQYLKHNDPKYLTRVILAVRDPNIAPRKFTMQNPNVFFLPGLSAKPWWDESKMLFDDDLKILSRNYHDIAKEFEDVFKLQDTPECPMYWSQNDTESGQWNIFCFYNQGSRINENCSKCPKTAEVLQKLPHFMKTSIFGNAFFSVLQPGTTVTEHHGPCNLRIRCHLGRVT